MLEQLLRGVDLKDFGGLRPRAWICAGNGFSREDVKSLLLSKAVAFTGDAVQTFPSLCQRVAGIDPRQVLQSPARQEVLRLLLTVAGLKERFPELKRLKRQGAFLRKLDSAIQAGRMAFAHWEEAEVYSERLGQGAVRAEIEALARAYEDWLVRSGYWDPPLLARKAAELLNSGALPGLPETVFHLSGQTQESLERSFWEALARHARVVQLGPAAALLGTKPAQDPVGEGSRAAVRWQRWHTLDDAAESLCDELLHALSSGGSLEDAVVLIPDFSSSRRSLGRALGQRSIPLSDPRDPTRIRWDEAVKWALLPLEAAARGFERQKVIALARGFFGADEELLKTWIGEIHDRGIRGGLKAYAGGKLSALHRELEALAVGFASKKTLPELVQGHLEFLDRALRAREDSEAAGLLWVRGFFEQLWRELGQDLERVGLADRRAGALYWLERLQSRVSESQAPVEKLRPQGGLDVYRLHQAPPKAYKKIFLFGLPPLWLSPDGAGAGDYWFSEKEREMLASEFAVRSAMRIRDERIEVLRSWLGGAEEVVFLDASYEPDGRERETILPVLEGMARLGIIGKGEPDERGSHARWARSYGALRPAPPQEARLSPGASVISASTLENYSRCGFLALARQRWKLEDLREPDTDLWPQVKGILLHEAVRVLVESRDNEGNFGKTIEEAIELAWLASRSGRPRGLLPGRKIERYVRRRLSALLSVFVEQERKYARRSGTRVIGLEDVEFKVDYPGFSVVGEPDRIDEHPDGLWIIDYKTSSQAPNGSVMLENGYRLQLPFYALAARRKFGKAVLGFQFVQLDRKGTRTNGVYFKPHNGKEAGKLTATTAASKSLLGLPREEVWARFEHEIEQQGARYVAGEFVAMPRISPRIKECASCAVSDFCGYRRLIEDPGEQDGEPASEGNS